MNLWVHVDRIVYQVPLPKLMFMSSESANSIIIVDVMVK